MKILNRWSRLCLCLLILPLTACETIEAVDTDVQNLKENIGIPRLVEGRTEYLLANECPQIEIVDDLSSLSDFSSPKSPSRKNLISRIDIKSAESTCKLASKSAIIDLKVIFQGSLGPKGRNDKSEKPFFSYPFFIVVTTPTGKILAKEIFAASMTFTSGEDRHTYFEQLRQIIPINSKEQAYRYRVLIGFQVTPDQLAYNRKHMVPVKKTATVTAPN